MAPQAIARGDGDPLLGLAVGTRFGVVGLRATGAHAAVYDAWDAANADACVLKIVRGERHALGRVHDLFLREASLMRAAPVAPRERGSDLHEPEPSFAWLAMDSARGERITESEGPIEALARASVRAVGELHAANVFHGDLKPDHLLFAEGRVTILDFGCAAFAGHAEDAPRETTPAYAAPEREVSGPSAASDIYSLGCVLFELSTGRRPFARLSGAELARAHEKQSVSCDAGPPALRSAIAAALQKGAVERPTAAELLALVA